MWLLIISIYILNKSSMGNFRAQPCGGRVPPRETIGSVWRKTVAGAKIEPAQWG